MIAPSTFSLAESPATAQGRRAHLVGIGGTGMQALAELLTARGWQISGSDTVELPAGHPLAALGVRSFAGHRAEYLRDRPDLVIHSDAVPPDNIERREASRLKLPQRSYPQVLAELMSAERGIAIAGTHGKSTVTAMVGQILVTAGLDPSMICGAAMRPAGCGGRGGRGPWFVAEACEYRANFLHFRPQVSVITGVEHDHFDFYQSTQQLRDAFCQFAAQTDATGTLILNSDCPMASSIRDSATCQAITFGRTNPADWQARPTGHSLGCFGFELIFQGISLGAVELQVPGQHQIANALAAAAASAVAGAKPADILRGLADFSGLRRRLEHVAHVAGVDLVDDYAHHPTEVRAALSAVRLMYPNRRLLCIFQPHQLSRTAALLDEFAISLQNVDSLAVAEVFTAREDAADDPGFLPAELARRVAAVGTPVLPECRLEAILHTIVAAVRPGDVVVTLGAGDIRKRSHDLADRIRAHRAKG